jgi:Zn-dependent M28 family amino/carboxypeptidase
MSFRPLLTLLALAPLTAAADGPSLSEAAIRAHLEFLADDALEGRATGTRGFDLAALYVAAVMAASGLRPGGVDGTWYQQVPLIEALRVVPPATFAVIRDGERTPFTVVDDFLPGVDYTVTERTFSGPLAFAGFGVSAPELGHDDFTKVDVRGRIAIVLSGAPPSFSSDARAHYSAGLTKLEALQARGATGVVYVDTPEDEKSFPWAKFVQTVWQPSMRWIAPDGRIHNEFPDMPRTALSPAGARRLFALADVNIDTVFAAAANSTPQGFSLPLAIEASRRSTFSRLESSSVVGLLEGSDPSLKGEFVVLTAHLDHLGKQGNVAGDSIYNGAFDNASGVAVMLEAARLLARTEPRPRRSILFVALTAEEKGLLGAEYFIAHPPVPRSAIVANINMDMPLMPVAVADLIAYGAEHSTLGPMAERAAAAEGFTLSPDPQPEEVVFVRSDQYAFVRAGVPALYLGTGMQARDPAIDLRAQWGAFLQDRYHMPTDDAAQPIDYPSLAALARVNERLARNVADAGGRPQWNAGDFFGDRYAPR